jgi:hypothetical protein
MRIVVAGFLVVISVALFVSLQCTAKATAQASVAASPYLIERVANNTGSLLMFALRKNSPMVTFLAQ